MSDVKVPTLAESVTEGDVGSWLKKDGDTVRKGEPILELQTDKASLEIQADADGVLRIVKQEGETVKVGDVVARIEASAGGAAGAKPAASKASGKTAPPSPAPAAEANAPAKTATRPASRPSPDETSPAADNPAPRSTVAAAAPPPAAGPGQRLRVVHDAVSAAPADEPEAPAPRQVPRADEPGTRRERMTRLRRRIAERLVEAQRTAAILTTFNEIDMTAVQDLRKANQEWFQARYGVKLGFMSLFARACIGALAELPRVNASIEGEDIVYHDHVHLGLAVGTERGLVVPVVREAEKLSLGELEHEIQRLATLARDGKIGLDDLQGGTFTISNGGVYGSLLSTPILNPPQSGILGMHAIQKRAVVVDDQIVIRPMMYVALSYDHRMVDGEEAVGFLVRVKQRLEDPERMLLEA